MGICCPCRASVEAMLSQYCQCNGMSYLLSTVAWAEFTNVRVPTLHLNGLQQALHEIAASAEPAVFG